MKIYPLSPEFLSDRAREYLGVAFGKCHQRETTGPFVSPKRRIGLSKGTRRRRVIENRKREKKTGRTEIDHEKKKGEKEFRYRASPLESRYPNKYEDNDNDDACCARNRLELIQFPFLLPCSPFPTFLAVFCPLPPPPSPLLLSLNRSIQRFLFCPSFYIKLSLSLSLSSFSLQ